MKKSFLLIIALTIVSLTVKAQEVSSKTSELGFNLSGSQFGVRYKAGNEKILFRATFLSLYGASENYKSQSYENKMNQQGFGLNLGFEKRKTVNENISFYLGSDLLTDFYSYRSNNTSSGDINKNTRISAGLGFVIGVNFKLSDRINISTEVVPSVVYTHGKNENETQYGDTESSSSGINYGLSTQGINLTMSFSLIKKQE